MREGDVERERDWVWMWVWVWALETEESRCLYICILAYGNGYVYVDLLQTIAFGVMFDLILQSQLVSFERNVAKEM